MSQLAEILAGMRLTMSRARGFASTLDADGAAGNTTGLRGGGRGTGVRADEDVASLEIEVRGAGEGRTERTM